MERDVRRRLIEEAKVLMGCSAIDEVHIHHNMNIFIIICLRHGCANHYTEGKLFKSSIHCCDVTKPPYLFSGELCTSPCTVNSSLCIPSAVGEPGSASLSSEHVNQTSYRSERHSGRSYITEQ